MPSPLFARPVTRLRKAVYRLTVPLEMKHMRKLHPSFRMCPSDTRSEGFDVIWRGRHVTTIGSAAELAGRREGGDCFVVAAGPSVAEIDLRRLGEQICIGVNGSIVKAREAGRAFDYYVVTDRTFASDRFDLLREALVTPARCVFTFRVLSEICEREPELLDREGVHLLHEVNFVYGEPKRTPEDLDAWAESRPDLLLHDHARLRGGRVGFSRSLHSGVFTGQTVVFGAIQLAYAIGFRRVFVAGMDLGGSTGNYARFYEDGESTSRVRLDRDYDAHIAPSFELLDRVRRTDGFEVFNLAKDSRLPARTVPKISFDEALARAGQ